MDVPKGIGLYVTPRGTESISCATFAGFPVEESLGNMKKHSGGAPLAIDNDRK